MRHRERVSFVFRFIFVTAFFVGLVGCGSGKEGAARLGLARPAIEVVPLAPESAVASPERHDFFGDVAFGLAVESGEVDAIGAKSISDWLSWVPDGFSDPARAECSVDVLENAMLAASTHESRIGLARDFLARCASHLGRHAPTQLLSLVNFDNMAYDIHARRELSAVNFQLPGGVSVRALVALKDDRPRPFVVIRSGMQGNVGGTSHRYLLMHLFDESPFHVMMVGNITGLDHVVDNQRFGIGGFEEGMQYIELARLLRAPDSPFAARISSLHLAALSLGGNGALFGSVFNDHNRRPDGAPYFNSSTALCPVVRLKPTLDDNFVDDLRGRLFTRTVVSDLKLAIPKVPVLAEIFPHPDRLAPAEIPPALGLAAARNYQEQESWRWFLAPFGSASFAPGPAALWENTDFLQGTSKAETPTLVLASENDPMVPFGINTGALERERGAVHGGVGILSLPLGSHCAPALSYGWNLQSALLRAHILANSPEFLGARIPHEVESGIEIPRWARLAPVGGELHFSQKWSIAGGASEFRVRFRVFRVRGPGIPAACAGADPFSAADGCYRDFELTVPLERLRAVAGGDTSLRVPENDAEAEALTRWANVQLKIRDAEGKPILLTGSEPARIGWSSY